MTDTIRIYGDSVMWGAITDGFTRPKPRQGSKFPQLQEMGYTVENKSRVGATIYKVQDMLSKQISKINSDTFVIIGIGGNDSNFSWSTDFGSLDTPKKPATSIDDLKIIYHQIIQEIKKTGAALGICNCVPIDAGKFYSYISRIGPGDTILSWLGDKSMLYRWHEYYNNTIEKIALAEGCDIIDIRSPFLINHSFPALIGPDGLHPTEEGYKILDTAITNYFKAIKR